MIEYYVDPGVLNFIDVNKQIVNKLQQVVTTITLGSPAMEHDAWIVWRAAYESAHGPMGANALLIHSTIFLLHAALSFGWYWGSVALFLSNRLQEEHITNNVDYDG